MSKRILVCVLIALLLISALPVAANNRAPQNNETIAQDGPPVPFSWLSECSEDLTGESYTFYHLGDISGPYAPISSPLVTGLQDAAELLNANGGLCGATVELENWDTGGVPERAQTAYDEFLTRDDAYHVLLYSSTDGELLRAQAADNETVLLLAAGSELAIYGESGDEPSWSFAAIPLYSNQLAAFCDHVAENWDSFGIEGEPTIGHLSWDLAFGHSSDTDGARAYCEEQGIAYAGAEYFSVLTTDVSNQLQGLVDAGANIIYTTTLATGTTQVLGALAANPDLAGKVLIGGTNWSLDTSVILLARQAGISAIGVTGNLPYLWWDEIQEPAEQIVTGVWAQKHLATASDPVAALVIRNVAYNTGFAVLDLWAETMIRSINESGSENLDGAAVYETLQNLQYDAFLGIVRADFTEGERTVTQTRIGQIGAAISEGGLEVVTPVSDWMEIPDVTACGVDNPIVDETCPE